MTAPESDRPQIGLFVTCLVDLYRPNVGFAALKLLEDAGCDVTVPAAQTCCGQPAYNSGNRADTIEIARQVVDAFDGFDYVVAPSGSCAGMLKSHYPGLLADDPAYGPRAAEMSGRVWELISFLTDVCGVTEVNAKCEGSAAYHDSCSGLRELKVKDQPRRLLASVEGLEVRELPTADTCCGFGGTFSVKYGDVSTEIVNRKAADIRETGADMVLAGDLGCLMNMAGKLKREGDRTKARHVAEVLAGMTDTPAIGEGS